MPNYVRVGPFVNGGAPGISSSFLNGVERVFIQTAGGTELGKYFLAGPVYANGAVCSNYIPSLSRGATPVSVSIDESDQVHTAGQNATPSTGQLTQAGFQIYNLTTVGPAVNGRSGGGYTIQY